VVRIGQRINLSGATRADEDGAVRTQRDFARVADLVGIHRDMETFREGQLIQLHLGQHGQGKKAQHQRQQHAHDGHLNGGNAQRIPDRVKPEASRLCKLAHCMSGAG
jgi:hypothetical protein